MPGWVVLPMCDRASGGMLDEPPGPARWESRREPTMTFHVHPLLADLHAKEQAAQNRRRFESGRSDRRSPVRRGRVRRSA